MSPEENISDHEHLGKYFPISLKSFFIGKFQTYMTVITGTSSKNLPVIL